MWTSHGSVTPKRVYLDLCVGEGMALQDYLAGELNNRYAHLVNLRRKKEKKPPCLGDRGRSCELSSSYKLAQAQRILLWTPFFIRLSYTHGFSLCRLEHAQKVLESMGKLHAAGLVLNKREHLIDKHPEMNYK
jgi:hypothetical protein